MKTLGQRVYEDCHPQRIPVVRKSALPFATAEDVFFVDNPVHQVPWHLLTQACRDRWEKYATGHHVVSGDNS